MHTELEQVVISIIDGLHERSEADHMDDAEYIPMIKTVIESVLRGFEKADVKVAHEQIREKLYLYARSQYLEVWLRNGEEDEDKDVAKQEGIDWFDFVYVNEKYPR